VVFKSGHLVFLPAALSLPRPRHSTANMQIIPFSSQKAPHNLTLSTQQFVPIPKWLPSTLPPSPLPSLTPFLVEILYKKKIKIEDMEGASKEKNPISPVYY